MFVVYYRTVYNAYRSVKNMKQGNDIGGYTKKNILSNTKQYNTFIGASRVANKLLSLYPTTIKEVMVVEFSKFEQYLDKLTCKCGCDTTILPIGGGCYNIPNIGIIRPQCYEIIVPKKYQGTVLAVQAIQKYLSKK